MFTSSFALVYVRVDTVVHLDSIASEVGVLPGVSIL
jgi:hypothetical protein